MSETYVLEIEWDRPSSESPVMPRLVGPFPSREEAFDWARLNVINGSYNAAPLAAPYLRATR